MTYLVDSFPQHAADELEQLQVVVLQVGGGRGVQPFLRRHTEQVQRRIKHPLDCLLQKLYVGRQVKNTSWNITIQIYDI
jgi:hypothetical protein